MRILCGLALLAAGCGGSAPLASRDLTEKYYATLPAKATPHRSGQEVLPGRLAVGRILIDQEGAVSDVFVELVNPSETRLAGFYRLRFFDAKGQERRTEGSMRWKPLRMSPKDRFTLHKRYPSPEITGTAVDYSESDQRP